MKTNVTVFYLNHEGYTEYPKEDLVFQNPSFSYCFLIEGEVLIEIEKQNILLGVGQLLLIPENKRILIQHYNGCKGYVGRFELDFLKDASYPALRSEYPVLQSFWFDDAVFMGALFKRMLSAYEDKNKAFLQSAWDLILGQIHKINHVAAIPERFLQLVFERGKTPQNVSDYAEILQVTPNYLNKAVKNNTHRTAIDWIEIARLNMAKQMLRDRSLSIAEIAVQTGLPDQSYFSRFFKKKTGITPTEYRNSL